MEFLHSLTSGAFFIPGMGVLLILTLFAVLGLVSHNYIRVPPNKVAIFYGRRRTTVDGNVVGFEVVAGGSRLKRPLLEDVAFLDLNTMPIDLVVSHAPNKDNVLVNVKGVATAKILSDPGSLALAAERFLGMSQKEIKDVAFRNLEGHLRGIVGQLTMEELISDRTKFNQKVLQEAGEDLRKLGLGVDVVTIQEVDDDGGYIKSLGQRRTAEVMRDANIGKANAESESRIRSTTAEQEAATTAAANAALTAKAERDRDVSRAEYDASIKSQQATAAQAGPLAEAKAKQDVVQAQVEIRRLETLKETDVAIAEAALQEKKLLATVIKPAEADKVAAIAKAEGLKEAAIQTAEAEKQKRALEGEGEAAAIEARGKGEAAAIRARGEAEADVTRLKLLAEAEGLQKKAEAFKALDEAGRTLQILEMVRQVAPDILKGLAPIMAEIAKPLASIDRVSVVDFGNGSNGTGNGVSSFAKIVPAVLVQTVEALKALGVNPEKLLEMMKLSSIPEAPTASKV